MQKKIWQDDLRESRNELANEKLVAVLIMKSISLLQKLNLHQDVRDIALYHKEIANSLF